jgi:hypothetical protein
MHRGHIIANVFGGSNGAINLVPLYPRVNMSTMRTVERQVQTAVQTGQRVFYEVTPVYKAESGNPVPIGILLEIDGNRGLTCDVTLLNIPNATGPAPRC